MAEAVTQFRIFIASPSDCQAEREAVRHIASQDQAIQTLCRRYNIAIQVFGWEDIPSDLGRPQSLINAAMNTFNPDWFVFIFWHRFGSNAGLGMTGSEEEWNLARQRHEEGGGRPWVSVYFNKADLPFQELDGLQFDALTQFRNTIWANYQALASHFRGTRNFESAFRGHLTARLLALSAGVAAGRPSGTARLQQEFFVASQGLLRWPRTLGVDQQIERPELQQLLECIHGSDSSTTWILGGPGAGKSALLASLGHRLLAEPVTFLAIKADMLGSTVTTIEHLRDWLHLSVDPRDAIRALAEREPVVLLIDQLDAVSELLNRQSGRLNVLLDLILSLADTRGVHIIATSREFEYRHDVRLTSIEAESVTLQLPAWEQISPILEQAGHFPHSMAEPLRALLRIPLHLKLFLEAATPGAVFESLQALLEQLWGKRVVDAGGPGDRLALLERMAQRMADEETLWLPAAAADDHPEARQALEQAEILTQGPTGSTLGFRHQTYYDFTLARAFARGTMSLTEHVLQRQDGLFIRPSLLSSLHYLRGTSRRQYQKQVRRLMASRPRQHIRTLIVEFLGQQTDPDDVEAAILQSLLDSPADGPRVLRVINGSPGWFRRLRHHSRLEAWMRKAPEEAAHCVPFLTAAASFDREAVLNLLEEYWCDDAAYDPLSLRVLLDLNAWPLRTVDMAARLVRRSAWWGTTLLIEQIAENTPDLAPRVLRADFDRRLEEALREHITPEAALPPEADEQEGLFQEIEERRRQLAPLRQLMESEEIWPDMDPLAQRAPQAFLDQIWPWFVDVVAWMADEEHPFLARYRDAGVSYQQFDDRQDRAPPLIRVLLSTLSAWPEQDPQGVIDFIADHMRSDLMIVHRLIARGLERTAAHAPQYVLDYLLGDSRRLALGDAWDHYRESIRLLQALCPYLSSNDLARLEEAVRRFTPYKRVMPEWSAEERLQHSKWARQDRLRLLRAVPEDRLSLEGRRLRAEEERAFPGADREQGGVFGGEIGARMTIHEMALASDDDLLRLFDELPDATEWDNPKRRWSEGFSQGGGAIQLSREFCQLAKQIPTRVMGLTPRLRPGQHEHYAGAAVEGLAETELATSELINLIDNLDQRGFASGAFRDAAALALERRARRDRGLPDDILLRLAAWLDDHPDPSLRSSEGEQHEQTEHRGGGPCCLQMGVTLFLPGAVTSCKP
jgi:hypothetical protein